MKEKNLDKLLNSRINLDDAIKEAEKQQYIAEATLETLIRIQDDFLCEGTLIYSRGKENYVKNSILWEMVKRATGDIIAPDKIDEYAPLVYQGVQKQLDSYVVFQNIIPTKD